MRLIIGIKELAEKLWVHGMTPKQRSPHRGLPDRLAFLITGVSITGVELILQLLYIVLGLIHGYSDPLIQEFVLALSIQQNYTCVLSCLMVHTRLV